MQHTLRRLTAAHCCTHRCIGDRAFAGIRLRCTTFESTGLPYKYRNEALCKRDEEGWKGIITTYLATPNPINVLYQHLGTIVHVLVPWSNTAGHGAKCVVGSAARLVNWLAPVLGPLGEPLARGACGVTGLVIRLTDLLEQHQITAMQPCWDPSTGKLYSKYQRVMATWPHQDR
jgi:hypothetical protein